MQQTSCQKTTGDGLELSIQHFIKQSGRSYRKALFMKYNMRQIWNNDHYAEFPTKSVNSALHCLILKILLYNIVLNIFISYEVKQVLRSETYRDIILCLASELRQTPNKTSFEEEQLVLFKTYKELCKIEFSLIYINKHH